MKIRIELTIIFVLTATVLFAQETRRTVVQPSPNPADDSRPNSNKVPEVYAISGHFSRIVVLRVKYKVQG
jgi:hypothetical protein